MSRGIPCACHIVIGLTVGLFMNRIHTRTLHFMTQQPPSNNPDGRTSETEDVSGSADDMLHRLGTPLTIISGYAQLIRRRNRKYAGEEAEAMDRSLRAIESAVDRMKDIVAEHREEDDSGEIDPAR